MIWILGSSGSLGREVRGLCRAKDIPFCASDREVDITSAECLMSFGRTHRPSFIVNCVGSTSVGETDGAPETAYSLNTHAARNVGLVAAELDVPLFFISTDLVFSGNRKDPPDEEVPASPLGTFGSSKLAGEKALQQILRKLFILRVSSPYGTSGRNLVTTILKALRDGEELEMPVDQYVSPTWHRDIARWILAIIGAESRDYGIYHSSSTGSVSLYELAEKIIVYASLAGFLRREPHLSPYSTLSRSERVEWPRHINLSSRKLSSTFGLEMPRWEDSLKTFIFELKGAPAWQ